MSAQPENTQPENHQKRRQWNTAHKLQPILILTWLLTCGWCPPQATAQSGTTINTPLLKIFFTDGRVSDDPVTTGTVKSVNPDGTGLTTVVAQAGFRPRGIVLDDINGHLYWNDFGDLGDPVTNPGRTLRSDLDGDNVTPIVNHGQAGLNDIDVDTATGQVYMALSGNPDPFIFRGARRVNSNGTELVDLFTVSEPAPTAFGASVDGLTIDPVLGGLYYGGPGDELIATGINRTNLDGGASVELVVSFDEVGLGRGVAVDLVGGKMYYAQHDPEPSSFGQIWCANLDGSDPEVIVTGLLQPRDVALDLSAGRIYWADEQAKTIRSAKLDGTDVQDVVTTGLAGPSSLTLEPQQCEPVENPDVRTQGFWKRVCAKPHPSGEHEKLDDYVNCVNTSATFRDVNSVEALCDRLHPNPKRDKCEQAEAQFMALLLNVCSGRVATSNCVSDPDLGETTVGEVITLIDELLSNADRLAADCVLAQSLADRINEGVTLADGS